MGTQDFKFQSKSGKVNVWNCLRAGKASLKLLGRSKTLRIAPSGTAACGTSWRWKHDMSCDSYYYRCCVSLGASGELLNGGVGRGAPLARPPRLKASICLIYIVLKTTNQIQRSSPIHRCCMGAFPTVGALYHGDVLSSEDNGFLPKGRRRR